MGQERGQAGARRRTCTVRTDKGQIQKAKSNPTAHPGKGTREPAHHTAAYFTPGTPPGLSHSKTRPEPCAGALRSCCIQQRDSEGGAACAGGTWDQGTFLQLVAADPGTVTGITIWHCGWSGHHVPRGSAGPRAPSQHVRSSTVAAQSGDSPHICGASACVARS